MGVLAHYRCVSKRDKAMQVANLIINKLEVKFFAGGFAHLDSEYRQFGGCEILAERRLCVSYAIALDWARETDCFSFSLDESISKQQERELFAQIIELGLAIELKELPHQFPYYAWT